MCKIQHFLLLRINTIKTQNMYHPFFQKSRMRIILASMLLFASSWNAQSQYKNIATIFEDGDSLTSWETNFKNLKRALNTKYITNANEYTILDYQFLGVITDEAQIAEYSSVLSSPEAPIGIVYVTIDAKQKVNGFSKATFSLSIDTLENFYNYLKKNRGPLSENDVWGNSRQDYANIIMNTLEIGHRVYVLSIEKEGKRYEDLVFCDPTSFKVVMDSFFIRIRLIPE